MRPPEPAIEIQDLKQLDTSELVDVCLAGNGDAWEELINRYQRLIYSIPIQAGMSRADAAEVFQLVSIRLLRKLSTLKDQQKLAKWIITTTTRETWRLGRKHRRDRDRTANAAGDDAGSYDLNEIAARLPLPDEQQQVLEQQQIVREAVGSLADRCRELLTLLFLREDEPSYREVARAIGMPESSIGPTRARCLEKLKKILEERL